jgi:hypothetical protein
MGIRWPVQLSQSGQKDDEWRKRQREHGLRSSPAKAGQLALWKAIHNFPGHLSRLVHTILHTEPQK